MSQTLQNAKNNLAQVGGYLTKAKQENPDYANLINNLLHTLKNVNTEINNMISGNVNLDFSFDEDISSGRQQSRVRESKQKDDGVDLGDFERLISTPDEDDNSWRKLLESTKDFSGVSLSNVDYNVSSFDGLRMVDNT